MFSKFSVRKPLTVFVGVIIVLILGVVSYTRMTPDLLPNINMPYAIVVTTYPGATPEEVEETITKPLEQAVATLDNIEDITSTSQENASTIMLSFSEDVNMDTVTSEIRERINTVSGDWDDIISTPSIMRINPNVMPVAITALNKENTNIIELTELLNSELLTKLEGTEGIASVTVSGNIEESVNVEISQNKIDDVNAKIKEALDKEFGEAEEELKEKSDEIDSGLAETESKQEELSSQLGSLQSGQEQLIDQVSGAQSQLIDKKVEIESAKAQITTGLQEISQNLTTLKTTRTELISVKTNLDTVTAQIASINEMTANLTNAQMSYNALQEQKLQLEAQIVALEDLPENEEQLAQLKAQLAAIDAQTNGINTLLETLGITFDEIPAKLIELENAKIQAEQALEQINAGLTASGLNPSALEASIAEVDAGIAQLQSSQNTLNSTMAELEAGAITVDEALAELNRQQASGMMQISSGIAQITAGQSALSNAQTQLEAARVQLDDATADFEKQRESAYKAANLDITMAMVSSILTAQNFTMPAGYITEGNKQTLVKVGDKIEDLEEMKDLLLFDTGIDSVEKIYLKDVAVVSVSDNSEEIYSKLNGGSGILLSFTKQSTYSTAAVSSNILAKFDELSKEYEGLSFTNLMDQGDYIYIVVDSVLENLLLGALFAIVILFLFLRDLRPTLVVGISIPISLLLAIVLMYFSGVTLNVISLSGLAVGVGMLVDNSVVVIENIYRIRSEGVSAPKAAVYGTVQVTGAIFASTLTTICVFLPIVFIEGITRQLFTDMALTIGYALMASLFVAITLVPAMSSSIMKSSKEKSHKLFNKFTSGYGKLAAASLKHKWVILSLSVILLAVSIYLSLQEGLIFMPSMSGEQITVSVSMDDEDATFDEKSEMMDLISERISAIDDVEYVGSMISGNSAGGGMLSGLGGNGMSIYVLLSENAEKKDTEISKIVVDACEDLDCEISAQGAMDMSSYMTALGGSGVTVNIYSDNMDDLIETAADVTKKMEDIEGIDTVTGDLQEATPEIRIVVDKNKAMENGLTTAQVFQNISTAISETNTATSIKYNGDQEDVIVHNALEGKMDMDYLKNFVIKTTDARSGEDKEVKLLDIAQFKETESLSSITRENQRRYVSVSGTVKEGYNISLVSTEFMDIMNDYYPLSGVSIEYTGENETIMDAMDDLMLMMLLAVVIIYLIMVIQFQSLLSPFIVMFTIPLAFTGGFALMYITGNVISIISVIGLVMLAGIIVNNGIVLVDYVNQLRRGGMEKRTALIEACKTRMRPVLMTTLTTVFGLVFMALGNGMGAELMQPIAITCIGGLIYGTIMTMFVVPALYDIFNRKEIKVIDIDEDNEIKNMDTSRIAESANALFDEAKHYEK